MSVKDESFYTKDLKVKMQAFMTDLCGIPFIRENMIFMHFLEFDGNYLSDEDYDPRRTILQHGGSFANTMNNQYRERTSKITNPF